MVKEINQMAKFHAPSNPTAPVSEGQAALLGKLTGQDTRKVPYGNTHVDLNRRMTTGQAHELLQRLSKGQSWQFESFLFVPRGAKVRLHDRTVVANGIYALSAVEPIQSMPSIQTMPQTAVQSVPVASNSLDTFKALIQEAKTVVGISNEELVRWLSDSDS